jgi:hypothetical protein
MIARRRRHTRSDIDDMVRLKMDGLVCLLSVCFILVYSPFTPKRYVANDSRSNQDRILAFRNLRQKDKKKAGRWLWVLLERG